jgi:taurine dioxygenase
LETVNLTVRPLSPVGGEVSGIDLREELPENVKQRLRDAYNTYALLILHDQEMSNDDQVRFTAIFGNPSEQGGVPGGVNFVTSLHERGFTSGGDMQLYSVGELKFHFGHSFHEKPLKGVMLYGMEIPPPEMGGNTLFVDSRLAFKLLPAALRSRIANLKVRHKSPHTPKTADHPLIYTHPDTGEQFLYLSRRHVEGILDVSAEESAALIDELASYIEDRPEIVYRHIWKPKDLVVWDNLRMQHARTHYDPAVRRHLRRTQFE